MVNQSQSHTPLVVQATEATARSCTILAVCLPKHNHIHPFCAILRMLLWALLRRWMLSLLLLGWRLQMLRGDWGCCCHVPADLEQPSLSCRHDGPCRCPIYAC